MNIILLSGGSGKRLWPMSNDIRSKQFLKIFKNKNGCYESMVQRMYNGIKRIDPDAKVTVATSKLQVSALQNHLGSDIGISVEPTRRDTFPAIALATAYLADEMEVDPSEPVVVFPVDPYVDDTYFEALEKLGELADDGKSNLTLMGIEPTEPSEKFGYIIPEDTNEVSKVSTFKEKPDTETAKKYIEQGALWNGGVFAYRISYVLDKAKEIIGYNDYASLFENYENLEKISFDYAVVEREDNIRVMRYSGQWCDLGTWDTLTEVLDDNAIGYAILNEDCKNVHVINEMNVPMICMGLHDIVAFASPDGILISDKEQSAQIKPIVDNLHQEVMFAEKSYGTFRIIDIGDESVTIKVDMEAKEHMNYHAHRFRDEIWTVISGVGRVIVNDSEKIVQPGDVVKVSAGIKHTIIAETDLQLIEVQVGKNISVDDKEYFEWDF